jgi:hypothetical protein
MHVIPTRCEPLALREFTTWTFAPSGDLTQDAASGRRLALEYLSHRHDECFPIALGYIVQAIAKLDRPISALETSFFHAVNSYLIGVEVDLPSPSLRVIDGGKL